MPPGLGALQASLSSARADARVMAPGAPPWRSRAGAPNPQRWIVISSHGVPDWVNAEAVRATGAPFRVTDAEAQGVAARQGLGITTLPCFVADPDPRLARVPGADLHMYGTLWLLTQGETRKTKRVQLFTAFISARLAAYAPRLAGRSPSHD